jgi:hypothetical protein
VVSTGKSVRFKTAHQIGTVFESASGIAISSSRKALSQAYPRKYSNAERSQDPVGRPTLASSGRVHNDAPGAHSISVSSFTR